MLICSVSQGCVRTMPDPDVEDWEAKAARAREATDQMCKPAAIRIMLEIAEDDDVLASEARDHVASSRPGNGMILSTGDCAVLPLPQHDPPHQPAADALDAGEQFRLPCPPAAAVVAHPVDDVADRCVASLHAHLVDRPRQDTMVGVDGRSLVLARTTARSLSFINGIDIQRPSVTCRSSNKGRIQ